MHAFQKGILPLTSIFFSTLLFTSPAKAFDTSNDMLMNATIIGAIASLGYACYEGKAPCSLTPDVDTDKLTISMDVGADDTIQQVRLAVGADWMENLYEGDSFEIGGRWEINANYWYSTKTNPTNKDGYILGATPVFHYRWKTGSVKPYFELGGGPQWLSNITIEDEYKSTQFQFGSILGFGVENDAVEFGYRYLHISNANIELPNPGTDFHSFHIGYKF